MNKKITTLIYYSIPQNEIKSNQLITQNPA
jgi:hypothetical protein